MNRLQYVHHSDMHNMRVHFKTPECFQQKVGSIHKPQLSPHDIIISNFGWIAVFSLKPDL